MIFRVSWEVRCLLCGPVTDCLYGCCLLTDMENDELWIKRIRDMAALSWRRGGVIYSDFLSLYEQSLLESVARGIPGVCVRLSGGYPAAERRMAAFFPADTEFGEVYPISCLKILPQSVKFAQPLTHRDYLGALMHLGIERDVIGDLVPADGCAWLFCHDRLRDFIMDQLVQVKHTTVRVLLPPDQEPLPEPVLRTVTGTVASVRLDSLTALAFRISRSTAAGLIEGGRAFVNGRLVQKCGFTPEEGDIISIRGNGRYRFIESGGMSKKGRCRVVLGIFVS